MVDQAPSKAAYSPSWNEVPLCSRAAAHDAPGLLLYGILGFRVQGLGIRVQGSGFRV